jgi:hypothetical protein
LEEGLEDIPQNRWGNQGVLDRRGVCEIGRRAGQAVVDTSWYGSFKERRMWSVDDRDSGSCYAEEK